MVSRQPSQSGAAPRGKSGNLLPILEYVLDRLDDEVLRHFLTDFFRTRQALLESVASSLPLVGFAKPGAHEPEGPACTAEPGSRRVGDVGRVVEEPAEPAAPEKGSLADQGGATNDLDFGDRLMLSDAAEPADPDETGRAQPVDEAQPLVHRIPPQPMVLKLAGGVLYPSLFKQKEIIKLREQWPARQGDVIVTCGYPLRGLDRLLTSLVGDRMDPYEEGLLDKPLVLEMGASMYGAQAYTEELSDWTGLRLMMTQSLPDEAPFKWPPSEEDLHAGNVPKMAVLVADPRHAMAVAWEISNATSDIGLHLGQRAQPDLGDYIEAIVEGHIEMWTDPIKHACAWAREAERWPEHVRVFDAGRFSSLDPREVVAACAEFAEFAGVPEPEQAAECVVSAVVSPLQHAPLALSRDPLPDPEAIRGGPLVPLVGPRVQAFEDSVSHRSPGVKAGFRQLLYRMMERPLLQGIAGPALHGASTVPRLNQLAPLKGQNAHAGGTCRPCIFARRGACKNKVEMCPYCHLPGHQFPPRLSRRKRLKQKARMLDARCRTPSPDSLSS